MGFGDNLTNRQFARDESERLVFLPRGRRRAGYIVDGADETKIRSLVKVYFVAATLINIIGTTASVGFAQLLAFDQPSLPLTHEIGRFVVVYAISSALLYVGPALLLWNVYRRVTESLCASMTSVNPSSLRLACLPSSSKRIILIVSLVAFVLVAIAILAMRWKP